MNRGIIISLASVLVLAGCTRTQLHTGTASPQQETPGVLRYYVPRDLLTVTADVKLAHKGEWDRINGDSCLVKDARWVWTETSTLPLISRVADPQRPYGLAIDPGRRSDHALKLTVNGDGLLTGLNYTATDRTGEIVLSGAKALASIAGSAVGWNSLFSNVKTASGLLSLKSLPPAVADTPSDKRCWEISTPNSTSLLREYDALTAKIAHVQAARDSVLFQTRSARDTTRLKVLQRQDALLEAGQTRLSARRDVVKTAIQEGINKIKKQLARDTTIQVVERFDLTEVPAKLDAATLAAARVELRNKGHVRAAKLLDTAKIVIVLAELPPSGARLDTANRLTKTCANQDDCASIHYRTPLRRELRIYAPAADTDVSGLRLVKQELVSVIRSDDPVRSVAFESTAFGKAGITVGFAEPGVVTAFEHTSTAGAAEAANSIAGAITAARDEFVKGTQAVGTVQTTLIGIESARRQARLKDLQDQKAILDAQIGLEGSTASRTLLEQKQLIDAQIALLTSQQQLSGTLARGSTTEEVSQLKAELERMQGELDLLKKQLELEKTRRELEAARAGQ